MTNQERQLAPKKCCGKLPAFSKCGHSGPEYCDCVDKIECYVCGRVVFGAEDYSVAQWNDGDDDEVKTRRNEAQT